MFSQICSGGQDRYLYLFDVTSARIIRYYREHSGPIHCVCYNEDGSMVLSASFDGSVRLFDCKSHSRESVQILPEAKDSVSCVRLFK